jgi:hypothetical protein
VPSKNVSGRLNLRGRFSIPKLRIELKIGWRREPRKLALSDANS